MEQRDYQLHYGPSEIVKSVLNKEMEAERCQVVELQKVYQKLPKAMAFQKDSELVGLFNFYIKKFAEEGQVC